MAPVSAHVRYRLSLLLFISLFLAAGLVFLPLTGLQNDEALFGLGIYATPSTADHLELFGKPVPLMISSYIGGLKAWLYKPILAISKPSLWSIRLPVLLIGIATLLFLWRFLSSALGPRAAIFCIALLALDPVFLLTNVYDWGPVALQHLLLAASFWAFWRFHSNRKPHFLAAGCFFAGLALWDKAVAIWVLSGFGLAALLVYTAEVRAHLTRRHIIIAVTAFLLGASILLAANFRHGGFTFRNNAALTFEHIPHKARVLMNNLDGSALFGYLTRPVEVSSAPVSTRRSFGFWAFVAAICLTPFWTTGPSWRFASFSIIALALSWFLMACTQRAGYGPHHAVLLWPLPQFIVAAVLASVPLRPGLLLSLVLAASNLIVLNQYRIDLLRDGPAPAWTHAVHAAADYLERTRPTRAITLDWGLTDNLRLLTRGHPPVIPAGDIPPAELAFQPGAVFLIHAGTPILPFPLDPSLKKETIATLRDRHGRPAIDILRLTR